MVFVSFPHDFLSHFLVGLLDLLGSLLRRSSLCNIKDFTLLLEDFPAYFHMPFQREFIERSSTTFRTHLQTFFDFLKSLHHSCILLIFA